MDWKNEAEAVLRDIRPYVLFAKVSIHLESSEIGIYLELTTLEKKKLIVAMDSSGFHICDEQGCSESKDGLTMASGEVRSHYETINALLNDTSQLFREAFARDLHKRIEKLL